jgi:hypothetical protein
VLALSISEKKSLVVFAEGGAQVVEHRQETLSSNPSPFPSLPPNIDSFKFEFSICLKVNF